MPSTHLRRLATLALYGCATLQFARFYVTNTHFYLNLPAYLAGHERQPFQERILPAVLMRWFYRSPLLRFADQHSTGAFTPDRAPFLLISFVSLLVAGYFVQRLYRSVTTSGALSLLAYPIFLFCMVWTYVIHQEANFSYPYDMSAVAFFSAGLYFIYARRYLPLLLVVLVGTFNRETTLFLIGIYLLDAMAGLMHVPANQQRARFLLRRVPWLRVAWLSLVWLAVKLALAHMFAHNNATENHVRVRENIASLQPRLWPALLNICGYMLPVVLLQHREMADRRFRSYLWILPLWFGVMFYTGVLVETRIYGELCPYVAVAFVLIMEQRVAQHQSKASARESEKSIDLGVAA